MCSTATDFKVTRSNTRAVFEAQTTQAKKWLSSNCEARNGIHVIDRSLEEDFISDLKHAGFSVE